MRCFFFGSTFWECSGDFLGSVFCFFLKNLYASDIYIYVYIYVDSLKQKQGNIASSRRRKEDCAVCHPHKSRTRNPTLRCPPFGSPENGGEKVYPLEEVRR